MSGLDEDYAPSGCESAAFFHNSFTREALGAPQKANKTVEVTGANIGNLSEGTN